MSMRAAVTQRRFAAIAAAAAAEAAATVAVAVVTRAAAEAGDFLPTGGNGTTRTAIGGHISALAFMRHLYFCRSIDCQFPSRPICVSKPRRDDSIAADAFAAKFTSFFRSSTCF